MRHLSSATRRKNIGINMTYGCEKDPNTYCYRLDNEGQKFLHRIMLGRGWEDWAFDATQLSCYVEGEDGMIPKREAPSKELLLELWQKHRKIDPVRKELKTSWPQARKWLMEAGIIDAHNNGIKQTPPEPEQAANQEPAQDVRESADTIIPESSVDLYGVGKPGVPPTVMPWGCELPPRTGYTSAQYQEQLNQATDDEVMPYSVVPQFDLTPVKLQLIATVLAEYRDNQVAADTTLKLIRAIQGIEVA